MRRFREQRLLSLLLVLAVGVLQALGAVRGYACDCADDFRVVASPRCGGTCHPGGAHHDHGDHGQAGHTHQTDADGSHEHHEVRGSVDAAGTLKAASSELTVPSGVAVLPPGFLPSFQPAPRVLPSGFDSGPPPPLLVARAVVRQV
ncbi:MAG: hypothetical protein ACKVYV_02480 [Limisphaerales bacterium]